MAAVVGGRAIHSEAQGHPGRQVAGDGGDARGEAHVRRGAVRHPGARGGQAADLVVVYEDPVGKPDVGAGPAQVLGVLDGTGAEGLQAEALLVHGLGEMGVEPHPLVPGQLGRGPHQVGAHREGGTGGDDHLGHRPGGGVVVGVDGLQAALENGVFLLYHRVGGQAAPALPQAHRAA